MTTNPRYDVKSALASTLDYLDWHFAIIIGVSLVMTLLSYAGDGQPGQQSRKRTVVSLLVTMIAFSTFGFVTAFFMALGIDPAGNSADNKLIATFSAPFISLVTAGITYLSAKKSSIGDRIFPGVGCFLLTCVLSYQTFFNQKATYPIQDDTLLQPISNKAM